MGNRRVAKTLVRHGSFADHTKRISKLISISILLHFDFGEFDSLLNSRLDNQPRELSLPSTLGHST
jgi:hypothetical protein